MKKKYMVKIHPKNILLIGEDGNKIFVEPKELEKYINRMCIENSVIFKGIDRNNYTNFLYFNLLELTYKNVNFLFKTILNINVNEDLAIIL